jgi:hypothetical protein
MDNTTAASTTTMPTAAAINLGANIFQTIKCRLNIPALNAVPNSNVAKYDDTPRAVRTDCLCTFSVEAGYGKGGTFQRATRGDASAKRKCGPNELKSTVNGDKGYVTVEVRRKADFHWMDGIVDW